MSISGIQIRFLWPRISKMCTQTSILYGLIIICQHRFVKCVHKFVFWRHSLVFFRDKWMNLNFSVTLLITPSVFTPFSFPNQLRPWGYRVAVTPLSGGGGVHPGWFISPLQSILVFTFSIFFVIKATCFSIKIFWYWLHERLCSTINQISCFWNVPFFLNSNPSKSLNNRE